MAESKPTSTSTTKGKDAGDGGTAELQRVVDAAKEKGYYGETPDDTPNRNYTVAGVTEGAPTPETATQDKGA